MAKKPSRKGLIRKLDQEFGECVRRIAAREFNGRCPFCFVRPIENAFHFLTRRNYSTRWEFENATGSCAGCNIKYEREADFVKKVLDWYEVRFGKEAWESLVRKHHIPMKFGISDLEGMREFVRKRMEALN